MAFGGTVTYRNSDAINGTTTTGDVGDTFTPAEDDIILVFCKNNGVPGDMTTTATASNWNITFSEITGAPWGSDQENTAFIGRVGASPSSDRVSITRSGTVSTAGYFVVQATGCKSSGTPMSVLQQISAPLEQYEPGSPPYVIATLSAFQTDSFLLTFTGVENGPCTWKTPTGYTRFEGNWNTNLNYYEDEDTTPEYDFTSIPSYSYVTSNAFELLAEPGGGGSSVVPRVMLQHNQFGGGIT